LFIQSTIASTQTLAPASSDTRVILSVPNVPPGVYSYTLTLSGTVLQVASGQLQGHRINRAILP
jgi:hypothetical protein